MEKAGLLTGDDPNKKVDVNKISKPAGKTFVGFTVKMPGGTTKYVQIKTDGTFIDPNDKDIVIPIGTKIDPIFKGPNESILTYTITDVNGKESTVPVKVQGASTTSAKWSEIKAAAAGVNLGPAGPGGSSVTGWKYGSGDYNGTDIANDDTLIPASNKIGPVLTTNYSISDGSSSHPATFANVTYPNAEKTLKEIFTKASVPSNGTTVTAPTGKAFDGWKVTKPDGTVVTVKASEVENGTGKAAGKFPVGTKIEPAWVAQYVANLGTDETGTEIGIEFTEILGGDFNATQIGGFYIANTEITRGQWRAVMAKDYQSHKTETDAYWSGSSNNDKWNIKMGGQQWEKANSDAVGNKGDMDMPMNFACWYDAIAFCNMLSIYERDVNKRKITPYYYLDMSSTGGNPRETDPTKWPDVTFTFKTGNDRTGTAWDAIERDTAANGYRIPEEDQWEFAAHGGDGLPFPIYSGTTYNVTLGTGGIISNSADQTEASKALNSVAWFGNWGTFTGDTGNYSGNSSSKVHKVGEKGGDNPVRDMTGNISEWCWNEYNNASRIYRGGAYDAGPWYQVISNKALNTSTNVAGNQKDRSEGMGIRIIIPVLPK